MKTLKVLLQEVVSGIKAWVNSNFAQESNTVHKTGNETITGNKTFSGGVYSSNYYYNGTEFQNKFVTLDTTQTINYSKTFAYGAFLDVHGYRFRVINDDMEIGVVPASNQWTGMLFTDKNKTNISEIVQSFQSNGNTLWQVIITPNEANAQRRIILGYGYNSANNVNNFSVYSDFTPSLSGTFNLGASNQKWKTFNGLNPGGLSLPSENYSTANLDPTNWNTTGSANTYTPPSNGWLGVQVQSADILDLSGQYVFVGRTGGGGDFYPQSALSHIVGDWVSNKLIGCVIIPVISGKTYDIRVKIGKTQQEGSIIYARFYPCLGNV